MAINASYKRKVIKLDYSNQEIESSGNELPKHSKI